MKDAKYFKSEQHFCNEKSCYRIDDEIGWRITVRRQPILLNEIIT
jgi:hypothetical protein